MSPESITQIITQAVERECASGQFQQGLRARAEALHSLFQVDAPDPVAALHGFAREYVEMTPGVIHCVQVCAERAGVGELFQPFIETATGYFAHPSVLLAGYEGLDGLLVKAYQCHRLMEEMYENNRCTRTSKLVDIEATRANLLAHQLIGEPFSNELDDSITVTLLQIAGTPDYYELNLDPFVEQVNNAAWDWMRHYWENLLVRNHIRFSLGSGLC